jgi:hypothetical protein
MALAALAAAVIGRPYTLPPELIQKFPELTSARWRVGGLPPRVGGWFLGRSTVSAITLWGVVYLAPGVSPSAELLLHELAHVHQFASGVTFPLQYLWESLRRGYSMNRFEVAARQFAADRVHRSTT